MDYKDENNWLMLGDCLERMKEIPNGCVDMVLCDLPYGTTACKWDTILPFDLLWKEYKRVAKKSAAIVLTAAQPFTSQLVSSNYKDFKYCWYWDKVLPRGHLNAKKQPLRVIEEVVVFYQSQCLYKPIKTTGHNRKVARTIYSKSGDGSQVYGKEDRDTFYDSDERYPNGKIVISTANQHDKQHPTQKPVALMEYLIKTYTHEGETVLDNCMGSGTTGVACKNLGRKFIGIEMDEKYFEIAKKRIIES